MKLTAARLKELVHYEPETGVFTRAIEHASPLCRARWPVGQVMGYGHQDGSRGLNLIGQRHIRAHRAAWCWMTGEWPTDQVDHMDGDPTNNRFANLRVVSNQVNSQNGNHAHRDGATGFLGVTRDRRLKKKPFVARIRYCDTNLNLGSFETAEAAHAFYLRAKRVLHPGFVN